ncbi:MAG: NrdJb, partial [Chromatiales bacterium]|nr:NrdJb [Chromatiales bacterium]
MTIKIDKSIVDYSVVTSEDETEANETPETAQEPESNIVHMHEKVARPEMLFGSTYKITTPLSEHALYVTINDIILNQGTAHE